MFLLFVLVLRLLLLLVVLVMVVVIVVWNHQMLVILEMRGYPTHILNLNLVVCTIWTVMEY